MTEFYAKIVPIEIGMFRYCVTIWKSHDGIESIWDMKKFIRINSARLWSEKRLMQSAALYNDTFFIKENDILRRKWSD